MTMLKSSLISAAAAIVVLAGCANESGISGTTMEHGSVTLGCCSLKKLSGCSVTWDWPSERELGQRTVRTNRAPMQVATSAMVAR
jgi:uncharacterized lipoprotein NlpE involved in copper resistance